MEGGAVQPVKVAAYKTPPAPVMKHEIEHAKPDIVKQMQKVEEVKSEPVRKVENSIPVSQSKPTVEQSDQKEETSDDFSPMPQSKPANGTDISVLWGQLLTLIQSPPTRALLKQWANPVKITPEETILSLKNEIFLNQVQSGSKKQAIVEALDSLFGQSNSNVVVRLPHPDDAQVKPSVAATSPVRQSQPKPQLKQSPVMKPIEKTSEVEADAVSYTHLTLPTILLV